MGRLFEAGRLLTFPTYRVGAYSRWTLIRGWALNQINAVHVQVLNKKGLPYFYWVLLFSYVVIFHI